MFVTYATWYDVDKQTQSTMFYKVSTMIVEIKPGGMK